MIQVFLVILAVVVFLAVAVAIGWLINRSFIENSLSTASDRGRSAVNKSLAAFQGESFCIIPIPFPNWYFVGPGTKIEEIHRRFRESGADSPVHRQVLTGLRGIGKTQIALE